MDVVPDPSPPRPLTVDPSEPAAAPPWAQGVRHRLLQRVADADESHLTVSADEGVWRHFREGVQMKVLRVSAGVMSYLLRLQPGASLPAHRHPLDEECVVLQGSLRVGSQTEIGVGAYHLAHQGALHAGITTTTGALIFLRGAVPCADHMLG